MKKYYWYSYVQQDKKLGNVFTDTVTDIHPFSLIKSANKFEYGLVLLNYKEISVEEYELVLPYELL